ncbi:MAG: hypothetical protein II897_09895 [Clostridia bacterium]|jgi:hypothetical protein|nr:hypothetical protein [Clostridia bacterium]
MDEEKCTLFSFMTGGVFAAVLHFICAVSFWCCLVFPLLSLLLFLLERNSEARVACLHTGVISLAAAVLAAVPVILWLIIRAATHAAGMFYIICTVLFVGIMLIIAFTLFAVEVTCAVRSLKKQPVEVPFISNWVRSLAHKLS